MNRLQLKSSSSDVAVEFSDIEGDYFRVAVTAHDHSAWKRVYAFTDAPGIAQLFADAAHHWRGWDGAKSWESVEGELRLEVSMDRLGHVVLGISVRSDSGAPDSWQLEANVSLEAGQLTSIAQDAENFFRKA